MGFDWIIFIKVLLTGVAFILLMLGFGAARLLVEAKPGEDTWNYGLFLLLDLLLFCLVSAAYNAVPWGTQSP